MKYSLIVSIAVFLLAAFPAGAKQPPSGAVEDSRELEPRMITLPSSLDGTVAVQGCSSCKRDTYTMTRTVQFFANDIEVSFADFKSYIRMHPDSAVLLVSELKQNVITRFHAQ